MKKFGKDFDLTGCISSGKWFKWLRGTVYNWLKYKRKNIRGKVISKMADYDDFLIDRKPGLTTG